MACRLSRANLKECQKAYDEYRTLLKAGQETANQISHSQEHTAKRTLDACTGKAAQFVQIAKVFNI